MTTKVIVIGGGVAGMTVAHELAKRGGDFEVHVYEASGKLGGKAETQYFEPSDPQGRFPGEHGFRFFPHFYRHTTQTMREVPTLSPHSGNGRVYGLLREAKEAAVVYKGKPHRFHRANPALNLLEALRGSFRELDADPREVARFAWDLLRFATSCPERRLAEYEPQSWEDFLDLGSYSDHFARLLRSIPSNLSAMKAEHGSARTIGNAALQVLWDYDPDGNHIADAVLAAPTQTSLLEPFVAHLERLGVQLHLEQPVTELGYVAGDRFVTGIMTVKGTDEADYYVLAVPIEQAIRLIPEAMRNDDVGLANLAQLGDPSRQVPTTSPMVGVQFFLDRDIRVVAGHVTLPYSEWALTFVSQQQFWGDSIASMSGSAAVKGVLSCIISDWNTPGRNGKKAADCEDADEILDEVWDQLKAGLPGTFEDSYVLTRHLDQQVRFENGGADTRTPLLIHPTESHQLRPYARTTIENLLLASDYVRTRTDLATMESADEAARVAVAAILRDLGVDAAHWPRRFEPQESVAFLPGKKLDKLFYDLGLPHPMQADKAERGTAAWALATGVNKSVFPEEHPPLPPPPGLPRLMTAMDHAAAQGAHTAEGFAAWEAVLTAAP